MQSHSKKLRSNLTLVSDMVTAAGPAFELSVREDLQKASSDCDQIKSLLGKKSCSHWIVNEQLCAAAQKLSRIYSAALKCSSEVEAARGVKRAALTRLSGQEEKYDDACMQLESFLEGFDGESSEVSPS